MRWSGISDQLRTIRLRWACPKEARLAAFVDQAAGSADEAPIMHHLARCEDCRSQVAFLARMQRPAPEMQVPAAWLRRVEAITAGEAKVSPMRRWVPVALVAAAAIVIAAMLLRQLSPVPSRPVQATTPTSQPQVAASAAPAPKLFTKGKQREREVFRNSNPAVSLRITIPAQGSRIAPGSSIRWQSIENGMYYEAQLLSADGELLWKAKVEATQTALPADLVVPDKRKCFLVVRAYLPDGKTVESGAVHVVLQPRS
jgi:hypothetical protein